MSSQHSPQRHLALALAEGMLAGLPTFAPTLARCELVVGSRPPWLPALVASCVSVLGHEWKTSARERLFDLIAADAAFVEACRLTAPLPRRYYLNVPTMGSTQVGLTPLALPDIPTLGDLADWLGMEASDLDWFADRSDRLRHATSESLRHYSVRVLPKRSGGWRVIESPKRRLRAVQRHLLANLLDYVPLHEAAHGFRRRHSPLSHAAQHVGQAMVLKVDLQDFFLSISGARVAGLFRSLGYPAQVAWALACLCTTSLARAAYEATAPQAAHGQDACRRWQLGQRFRSRHLPQGAPTSPALANLCGFNLDLRLASAAAEFGARYSRYADDLVFSGDRDFRRQAPRFLALVYRIVGEEGFDPNHRKTRLLTQAARQQVTGIVVNTRLNAPRKDYDRLKATLTNCVRLGPATQNRAAHPDLRAHLQGRVSHVSALNPTRGARLARLFDAIDWSA